MGRQTGFTLIELMIVVAIVAVVASIAVPNLLSARQNANEAAAIATLKSIASAQAQLQATGAIDANNNGAGEYGYFAELAGGVGLRGSSGSASTDRLAPVVLSANFAVISSLPSITGGAVIRSGYLFQMYLPSAAAVGLPEADSGGVGTSVPNAARAETLWCCYAWPTSFGNSGKRAFFINQGGDVLATDNLRRRYSSTSPPAYDAAYIKSSSNGMASTVAAGSSGHDDQFWLVVN